ELKDNDNSAHVVDSLDEGYEIAEALVVSSWEPDEGRVMDSTDSGDSHDGEELGDFRMGLVSEVLERS
ncbi:hypothetical protein A2U01_0115916, partial [Trifolium medium]|nr:hypothetical protein [Trifolium medium]